ncbi:hypothetical protein BVG79_01075 [Ketogulonicigenium robustum]|uniref:Helix-turn-helix domain-containing protein n=1 Tax=Ketogulonicigenium robustum TaxID=92947 RepID=A0A1W6NZ24_9RHOB|nr:helix-turn-helix domain-containing protein [Ketogulonicigenium robustum]ARO14421.1 hypothetical protein BVG79_01075 [Ketogulonicigenium robustum]
MSVKIMSAIWEAEGIDASECLVLIALADHADDEGRCYPSIARLCKRTKMSDRGVQKVIARLIEKGFVTVVQNAGRAGSNLYIINPDAGKTPEPCSPPNDVHPEPRSPPPEPRSENPRTTFTQTVKNHH